MIVRETPNWQAADMRSYEERASRVDNVARRSDHRLPALADIRFWALTRMEGVTLKCFRSEELASPLTVEPGRRRIGMARS